MHLWKEEQNQPENNDNKGEYPIDDQEENLKNKIQQLYIRNNTAMNIKWDIISSNKNNKNWTIMQQTYNVNKSYNCGTSISLKPSFTFSRKQKITKSSPQNNTCILKIPL